MPGHKPRNVSGERLLGTAPVRALEHDDVLAALRGERIEAPWLLGRPISGERCLTYS